MTKTLSVKVKVPHGILEDFYFDSPKGSDDTFVLVLRVDGLIVRQADLVELKPV